MSMLGHQWRTGLLLGLTLVAGCKPKVDPRSPFDEDDPRALAELERAAVADHASPASAPAPPGPLTVPGTGARTGEVTRDALRPTLDAGPAAFLRGFEVEAELDGGAFVGWRLIRFLSAGRPLTALDLMTGDVLLKVNGRALVKPTDLDALWSELYAAPEIVATVKRGGAPFELRFAITGPALVAPARAPGGPAPAAAP